ncbi:hypothetical protein ASF08_10855 [Methylobacterium sp. Leaf85]|nr:hypothetical protein ASF08_10855 [Methylobacterium sp. Leaf85]
MSNPMHLPIRHIWAHHFPQTKPPTLPYVVQVLGALTWPNGATILLGPSHTVGAIEERNFANARLIELEEVPAFNEWMAKRGHLLATNAATIALTGEQATEFKVRWL